MGLPSPKSRKTRARRPRIDHSVVGVHRHTDVMNGRARTFTIIPPELILPAGILHFEPYTFRFARLIELRSNRPTISANCGPPSILTRRPPMAPIPASISRVDIGQTQTVSEIGDAVEHIIALH